MFSCSGVKIFKHFGLSVIIVVPFAGQSKLMTIDEILTLCNYKGSLKADSHIACRAHAFPLPCRAAKGLEYVFPILFTQCDRV